MPAAGVRWSPQVGASEDGGGGAGGASKQAESLPVGCGGRVEGAVSTGDENAELSTLAIMPPVSSSWHNKRSLTHLIARMEEQLQLEEQEQEQERGADEAV
jgi:hypothetical protein